MRHRLLVVSVISCLAASLMIAPATAAEYPDSSVRVIYPYTAGGSGDALARVFADRFSSALGQQFFVDNRPGAGGNIGFSAGAKAPPDGYTLISVSPAFAINASLYATPGYDPLRDFTVIAPQSVVPNVLTVNVSSPFKTMKDLVEFAKANPGRLTFGSSGIGTSVHIAGEMLKFQTKIDIVHVPYRGASNAGTDLLGGRLDMLFDSAPSALSNVRSGLARALAVASKERLPELPDVPTTVEAGYPDLLSEAWTGLVAPLGTPQPIIDKLYAVAGKVNDDPMVIDRLGKLGGRPFSLGSRDAFAAFIKSEVERNAAVVKAAGLRVD